ncbi:MAG: glycosyltransferase family 2 protein [bacterium]
MEKKKVVIVMPAYNAASTLKKTVADIPEGLVDEIILVDDASSDDTVEIAKKLGIRTFVHGKNKGYGANQKTCYEEAIRSEADIVVMLHPDYQYDSRLIAYMINPLKDGLYDVMLGSRIRTREEVLEGGMPLYKYISNRFLTIVENIVLGQNLSEFHTGFRAYTRQVIETLPWKFNSDDFVFDTEFLVASVSFGFKIGETHVPARYFKEASSINFRRSVVYGISTLWVLVKFILHKWKIKKFKIFM